MVKPLLDNHIPRVWVVHIIGFIAFLSGEVYFTSSLIPLIPAATSSAVVVITVKVSLRPSSGVLLELFRHTVLLKLAYFITSPAPNIDTSSRSDGRVLLFLFLS